MVEQSLRKGKVAGSSPTLGSINKMDGRLRRPSILKKQNVLPTKRKIRHKQKTAQVEPELENLRPG